MLCSYLCGIVRILVRNLIQINGFFLSLPPPQIPPPWPRTIVLYSDSASYRIWGMHFFFNFWFEWSKIWLCFKISLYPNVLHYTKWNWAYSWNIIRGHLDFFMSCVDFFGCKILIKIINIPLLLKFFHQEKISWVNIYWMWLNDSFKMKEKMWVNLSGNKSYYLCSKKIRIFV